MKIHIVRTGDTIWDLVQKYNTPMERLLEANPEIKSKDKLVPGMKIRIPTGRIPISRKKREERANSDPEQAVPAEESVQSQETGEKDESVEPAQNLPEEDSSFSKENAESSAQETMVDTDSPEEQSMFRAESPDRESTAQTESLYGYPSPYFSTYPHVEKPKVSGYKDERESKYLSEFPYMHGSEFDMLPPPPMLSYYPTAAYWYVPTAYPMMPDPSAFVMTSQSPYMPMPGHADFPYSPYPYPYSQPQPGWRPPFPEPWMASAEPVQPNQSVPSVMASTEQYDKESSSREY